MGARLLRVNILSPITGALAISRLHNVNELSFVDHQAIEARLDVVAGTSAPSFLFLADTDKVKEFIQHEDRFTDVREALKLLNKMDFDKLIVSVGQGDPRSSPD